MEAQRPMPDCFGTAAVLDGTLSCEPCMYRANCAIANKINGAGKSAAPQAALDIQVGGGHYKGLKIQPAEYCYANNIGKLEGDAIYYLTRWRKKNGVEDLLKARHTIDILIELEKRHG